MLNELSPWLDDVAFELWEISQGHLYLTELFNSGKLEKKWKNIQEERNTGKHDKLTKNLNIIVFFCVAATFSDVNDDAKEEMEKDFTTNFDKDKSGKLDKEEMKSWLFPDDDFSIEEPKTLIKEADENHDGKLTMDEIMKNYKVFIEDEQDDSNHDEL